MHGSKAIRSVGAIALVAAAGACQSSAGPYVRNVEISPRGMLVFERCNATVTDYGFATTFDYDTAACSKSELPLPGSVAAAPPPVSSAPPPAASESTAPPFPTPVSPPSFEAGAPPASAAPPPTVQAPVPPAPVVSGGLCPDKMAFLPAGSFSMGDRKDRVKVGRFCMDVTEVTADAYALCVKTGQCSAKGLNCGAASTYNATGKGDNPINCVDWAQASSYCQSQGKRLPTEEEWEWAARGGPSAKTYPWGNVEPSSQVCWSGFGQLSGTCSVGNYQAGASPQGVLDLSGNVWEWTSGTRDSSGTERVARGGAWSSTAPSYLRASERYWTQPQYQFIYIGFRCVRTV